jgi:hypothetical protein
MGIELIINYLENIRPGHIIFTVHPSFIEFPSAVNLCGY